MFQRLESGLNSAQVAFLGVGSDDVVGPSLRKPTTATPFAHPNTIKSSASCSTRSRELAWRPQTVR